MIQTAPRLNWKNSFPRHATTFPGPLLEAKYTDFIHKTVYKDFDIFESFKFDLKFLH